MLRGVCFAIFLILLFQQQLFALTLQGTVIDKDTQQPLSGVTVYIRGASGEVYTNDKGEFTYLDLSAGIHVISLAYPGYELFESTIRVVEGQSPVLLKMARFSNFEGLKIDVEGEKSSQDVSRKTLTVEEIQSIPVSQGDVVKAVIMSFPGVIFSTLLNFSSLSNFDFSSMSTSTFIVRGGNPDDNLIFIDGIVALYPFHFGGLATIIPSDGVSSIEFFSGSFPAGFGHVSGSILDITTKRPSVEKPSLKVNINLLATGVYSEIPITDNLSLALGLRKSYFELISSTSFFPLNFVPSFWDYYAKLSYKPNENHFIDLIAFGAFDQIDFRLTRQRQDNSLLGNLLYNLSFISQGLHWKWIQSKTITHDVSLGYAFQFFNLELGNDPATDLPRKFSLDYQLISIKTQSQFYFGKHTIKTGLTALSYLVYIPSLIQSNGSPYGNSTQGSSPDPLSLHNLSVFLSDIMPLEWVSIIAGVDINLFLNALRDKTVGIGSFSPRLSFSLPLSFASKVVGSAGLYYQNQNEFDIHPFFGNPTLPEIYTLQFVFGYKQEFNRLLSGSIELYLKDLNQIAVTNPLEDTDPSTNDHRIATGKGLVYGAELFIKQELWKGLFVWFAYTLSQSLRKDNPNTAYYPSDFDYNHNLTFIASYGITEWLRLSARVKLVSGAPYTEVLGREIVTPVGGEDPTYQPILGTKNARRYPLLQNLSIRLDLFFDGGKGKFYLEINNLLNRRNLILYSYEEDYSNYQNPGKVYDLPLLPFLGLEYAF